MTVQTNTFNAQDFVEKLSRGGVLPPLRLTGLVKLPEESAPGLEFALGTRCTDWTTLPLELVESVEVRQTVPCRDHEHPLVTLTLKAPESAEAAALAALLRVAMTRREMRRVVRSPQSGDGDASVLRSGCAATCNPYEVDEQGHIYELYSCQDYGSGIAICYYH
jgi:hypothetical protein